MSGRLGLIPGSIHAAPGKAHAIPPLPALGAVALIGGMVFVATRR